MDDFEKKQKKIRKIFMLIAVGVFLLLISPVIIYLLHTTGIIHDKDYDDEYRKLEHELEDNDMDYSESEQISESTDFSLDDYDDYIYESIPDEPEEEPTEEPSPFSSKAAENAYYQAKNYLKNMPFSKKGLIDMLTSDYGSGFTKKQAEYAADQVGLTE